MFQEGLDRSVRTYGVTCCLVGVLAMSACDVCRDRSDTRLDVGPDDVPIAWSDLEAAGGKTSALMVASVWREVPDGGTEILVSDCALTFESSDPSWLILIPEDILLRYLDVEAADYDEAAEAAYQDWQAGVFDMDPGYLEVVSDERGLVPVLAYVRCPPVDCQGDVQDACAMAASSGEVTDDASGDTSACSVQEGTVTVTFGSQRRAVPFYSP